MIKKVKLLQDNRIEVAYKVGKTWNIPIDADKLIDKRRIKIWINCY